MGQIKYQTFLGQMIFIKYLMLSSNSIKVLELLSFSESFEVKIELINIFGQIWNNENSSRFSVIGDGASERKQTLLFNPQFETLILNFSLIVWEVIRFSKIAQDSWSDGEFNRRDELWFDQQWHSRDHVQNHRPSSAVSNSSGVSYQSRDFSSSLSL